ncbi:PEP-CTERM sorting domain-containing protein [Brasilonema sp. UFV-L1]|uniref:PEP-CTERM sorting domain-containing protein n=1 Tax=Brasilonema sp. UFV-L1 TaxID=2234130 RepID=UPI00145D4B09|nr:PEP-CTERM sorting domain-containing protein [Brasilonema sp. UFV-L1]NMG09906.1 hypothetical protein [Brasilonema sp. UFV-L1]
MALLKKLSMAVVTGAAAFLAVGTVSTSPAQAALFKYSFEGEGANGYIIYDDAVTGLSENRNVEAYVDNVVDYKIDLGDKGVYQGTKGTSIVFLPRNEDGIPAPEADEFELEVRGPDRQPTSEYTLVSYFVYPKGTFGGSTDLPTSVPSTATLQVYPYLDFPNTIGELVFEGTVYTRLEKIPEPGTVFALLGVSTLFFFRRQRRQTQPQVSNPLF